MRTLRTQIDIEATREAVWEALVDFGGYASWNPFIVAGEGTAEVENRLQLTMSSVGEKTMEFAPVVTASVEGATLEWLGSVGMRGLFDGRHRFELVATETGTRLTQSEQFTGILSPLVFPFIKRQTTANFEALNVALKERVELAAARGL